MDNNFKKLIETLQKALVKNGSGFSLCFDKIDGVTKLEDLFKLCDRESAVQELQKMATSSGAVLAKKWIPLASQIDYLTTTERDLRLRFRNRVQAFRLRLPPEPEEREEPKDYPVDGLTYLLKQLTQIENS